MAAEEVKALPALSDAHPSQWRPMPFRWFVQVDYYVVGRLRDLMCKRYGRNLRAGQTTTWTREWFETQGLYRLRGTIRYPGLGS